MRTCSLFLVLFLSLMAASLSAQRQKVINHCRDARRAVGSSKSERSPTTRRRWR